MYPNQKKKNLCKPKAKGPNQKKKEQRKDRERSAILEGEREGERERERERETAEGERLWSCWRSCGRCRSTPYGGHQLANLSIDEGQRGAQLRTEE